MARDQKYQVIHSSEAALLEEKNDDVISFTVSRRTRSIVLVILGLLLTGTIALIATITLLLEEKPTIIYSLPQLPEPEFRECGGNAEEAKRRNCTFDWMMHAWYTPECHHADLLQEYLEMHEWYWSLTPDASYVVPTSIIALGEHDVAWTTEWFHREHCTYMWKVREVFIFIWSLIRREINDGESE